jgi:aarF domain-containing kinase
VARRQVSTSERLYRARRIGTTFGRIYLGIRTNRFVAERLRPRDMDRRWELFHQQSAESIYDAAVELRGLILKGCQFLGSRADVLPPPYVRTLSRLQDRVPPHSFETVRDTVERELRRPLGEIFREFEREPMASASLAQVHGAVTLDGRRVAVKVQYPEIAALVTGDLANVRFLFRAVGWLERDFDVMPLIDELSSNVPLELDFVNEGRNAERIGAFFAGRDDLGVPAIHWDLTSERVLVMERVEGIKVSDVAALKAAGIDPGAVMRILVEAYCEQVLIHGFFHADPHPGNLLVQAGPHGPRVVFLDFGLAKQLPEGFRQGVVDLLGALIRGEPAAMAKALALLGFETRDDSVESLAELATFVLHAAQQVRARAHLDPDFAQQLREEIPERVRKDPIVRIPSHLVLVGRVLGLVSGLSSTLESRVDLLRAILPYAAGMAPRPPY